MPSVSLLLFCIYSMIFFLLSFQNKLWKLSLPQWDNANEISIPCSTFALLHSMCLFLARSQLYMIMLRIYEKMRMDQSYSFPPLYKITLSFIVHLKVKHDNCFKFLPLETRGEERKGRRKKKTARWSLRIFCQWQELASSVTQPIEKPFQTWKGMFCIRKMYITLCQQHPGGQRRVSPRRVNPAAAAPGDSPPPLSGGSVMALTFPRNVPGSFDTGNMHVSWQSLGCAAETMMYISFSSLTDWRL